MLSGLLNLDELQGAFLDQLGDLESGKTLSLSLFKVDILEASKQGSISKSDKARNTGAADEGATKGGRVSEW